MKRILVTLLFFLILVSCKAQDEECAKNYSMYKEFINISMYQNALPYYKEVFRNCPKFSKSIYNDGITIYKSLISQTKDQSTINKYVDTLKIIYFQRIQNFGQEAFVLAKYANDIIKYKRSDSSKIEAYNLFKQSLSCTKENLDINTIAQYFSLSILLYKNNLLAEQEIFSGQNQIYISKLEEFCESNSDAFSLGLIAKYNFLAKDYSKAIEFFNKAIALQENKNNKAELYFDLAQSYVEISDTKNAISTAKKSIEFSPNNAKAYFLLGGLFASYANGISDEFLRGKIYWLAADNLIKAKKLDDSFLNKVDKLLKTYSKFFPKKEEAFMHSIKEGDRVEIVVFDKETTIARF